MTELSAPQLHILRHSLGLTYERERYRNHFVTGTGSVDHPDCMTLVERGLMQRHDGNALTGGDDLFIVTPEGIALAERSLPKLTRGQKRYRQFLAADSGLTFGQWMKQPSPLAVRRQDREKTL